MGVLGITEKYATDNNEKRKPKSRLGIVERYSEEKDDKPSSPLGIVDQYSTELSTAPPSPSAVVNDSSLPVDPPSADLPRPAPVSSPMASGMSANAALRAQEMAIAEQEAARNAPQIPVPEYDWNAATLGVPNDGIPKPELQEPSIFNPMTRTFMALQDIANEQPGPTQLKSDLGMYEGRDDIGTAFQYGDLRTQANIQNMLADTESVLRDTAPMQMMQNIQNAGLPFINSVRGLVGADPLPEDAMTLASIAKEAELKNNAETIMKSAESLGFKPMRVGQIENFSDFFRWAGSTAGASGAPMLVSMATAGYLSPLVLGSELDSNLREIEGLSKEDRLKYAYSGGVIAGVLENIGLGILIKGLPKELVGKMGTNAFAKQIEKTYGGRVAAAFTTAAASEGLIETAQEGTFVGIESLAGKEFKDGEIKERLTEAAAGGAVIGGPIGGSRSIVTDINSPTTKAVKEALAELEAANFDVSNFQSAIDAQVTPQPVPEIQAPSDVEAAIDTDAVPTRPNVSTTPQTPDLPDTDAAPDASVETARVATQPQPPTLQEPPSAPSSNITTPEPTPTPEAQTSVEYATIRAGAITNYGQMDAQAYNAMLKELDKSYPGIEADIRKRLDLPAQPEPSAAPTVDTQPPVEPAPKEKPKPKATRKKKADTATVFAEANDFRLVQNDMPKPEAEAERKRLEKADPVAAAAAHMVAYMRNQPLSRDTAINQPFAKVENYQLNNDKAINFLFDQGLIEWSKDGDMQIYTLSESAAALDGLRPKQINLNPKTREELLSNLDENTAEQFKGIVSEGVYQGDWITGGTREADIESFVVEQEAVFDKQDEASVARQKEILQNIDNEVAEFEGYQSSKDAAVALRAYKSMLQERAANAVSQGQETNVAPTVQNQQAAPTNTQETQAVDQGGTGTVEAATSVNDDVFIEAQRKGFLPGVDAQKARAQELAEQDPVAYSAARSYFWLSENGQPTAASRLRNAVQSPARNDDQIFQQSMAYLEDRGLVENVGTAAKPKYKPLGGRLESVDQIPNRSSGEVSDAATQEVTEAAPRRTESTQTQRATSNNRSNQKTTKTRSGRRDIEADEVTENVGTIRSGNVFNERSQTLRQSLYRDAISDIDMSVDVFENKSTQEKFAILSQVMKDKFGLKNVTAPKEGAGYTQVNQLLDAYHNLQWMTHTMGMPNKAISLDGSLSLTLPDNVSRFLGAYSPAGKEIIMPQRSNSFAHEWGHALDYYLLDKYGNADPFSDVSGVTGHIRATSKSGERPWQDGTPKPLDQAFGNVINAMFFDKAETALKVMQLEQAIARNEARERNTGRPVKKLAKQREQLQKLKEGSGRSRLKDSSFREESGKYGQSVNKRDYYLRPTEMFARTFEAYIARSVEAAGGRNEFITKGDDAYKMAMDQVRGADVRLAQTFPKDEERHNIFLAMDQLMDALRAETIAEGTVADAPGDLDTRDAQAEFWGTVQYNESANLKKKKSLLQRAIDDQKRAARIANNKAAAMKARPHQFTGQGKWERKVNQFRDVYGGNFINTKRQILFNIADRYAKTNPQVKALLEKIIAGVATDPGSLQGRVTTQGGTFEEATRRNTRRFYATYEKLNKEFAIDEMTDAEQKSLRLLLTGESETTAKATPRMLKLAGRMRRELLNPIYDYMVKSNQDINYISDVGYMPRMLDSQLAIDDIAGFKGRLDGDTGAVPLYQQVIYENEFGAFTDDDVQQMSDLASLALSERMKHYLDNDIKEQAETLRDIVKQINELEALQQIDPDAAIEAQIEELQRQASGLHTALHTDLRDPYALAAADDWYNRILMREGADPSVNGVQGTFAKKRKLPPEADAYMNNYYLNATDAIMRYIPAAVRATEYNVRFGRDLVPERKKLDVNSQPKDYVDYLLEEAQMGGMKSHEAREVRRIVNMVTGRHAGADDLFARGLNNLNTMGTMAMLPRAVLSSVAEPFTAAVQTGRSIDGWRTFKNSLDGLGASLRGKSAMEKKMYYSQLANVLGVIDLPQTGEVVLNRLGGTSAEDSTNAARLATFFLRTGLTNITIAQRKGAMRTGLQYMIELSAQYRKEGVSDAVRQEARDALGDFGIRPDQLDTFTEFAQNLDKTQDGLYEIDTIMGRDGALTDMGELLSVAVNRFMDQTIQDPKIIDRPKWAEAPMGRIVFSIQSFIAAFQRNVLEMSVKRAERDRRTFGNKVAVMKLWSKTALPLFTLYTAHTVVSAVREFVFNNAKWEEESEKEGRIVPMKYLMTLGLSRSGFLGRTDPVFNGFFSMKYQSDLSNVLVGATGAYYLKALQRISGIGINNSPSTVSKEYQFARGIYDILIPGFGGYLATMPGVGTLGGYALGAADAAVTSPTVKHWVLRNIIYQIYGETYRPTSGGRKSSGASLPTF